MSNGKNLTASGGQAGDAVLRRAKPSVWQIIRIRVRSPIDIRIEMIMLHVIARPAAQEDMGMERLLEQLQQEYPAVMAAVYENFTASLRLSTATDEDLLQQAETLLRRITDFAKKEDYRPCCSGCGKTKDVRRFLFDGDARMLCPACRARAEADLTDQWQKKKFPHHSAFKGFIVVLVILLIGATTWNRRLHKRPFGCIGWRGNDGPELSWIPVYGWPNEKGQRYRRFAGAFGNRISLPYLCVAFELVIAIGQQQEITITGALMFIPFLFEGSHQSGSLFSAVGAFGAGSSAGGGPDALVCPLFLAS